MVLAGYEKLISKDGLDLKANNNYPFPDSYEF